MMFSLLLLLAALDAPKADHTAQQPSVQIKVIPQSDIQKGECAQDRNGYLVAGSDNHSTLSDAEIGEYVNRRLKEGEAGRR